MQRVPDAFWNELAGRHPAAVVERYRQLLTGSEPFFEREPARPARPLLDELAQAGYLAREERSVCPEGHVLTAEDERQRSCRRCGFSFEHEEPAVERVYSRRGRRSRDVVWVVTLHGMNTRGAWQEELSFKLARVYRHAVPVAIYKYGKLLVSPFLLLGQRRYAKRLQAQLQRLRLEMTSSRYGDRPDVIAHSFGTWLLGRVLELDPSLRLGRVVLTGSVIPPDYPWSRYLEGDSPRVEAVLCHHSDADRVVPLAQLFVARAGPSGVRGFAREGAPRTLVHRFAKGFAHSDYFAPEHLDRVMSEVWGEFLTLPEEELAAWGDPAPQPPPKSWRRPWIRWLTHPLKYGVLLLLALLAAAAGAALVVGAIELVGRL